MDALNLQQAVVSFNKRRDEAEALLRFSVNRAIQKLGYVGEPVQQNLLPGPTLYHASNLHTIKPRLGERIGAYCERLKQYRDPVNNEVISDPALLQHLQ